MRSRRRSLVVGSLVVGLLACAAPALGVAQGRRSVSLDANLGSGYGRGGGERVDRNAIALDGLLGWRARTSPRGALLVGLGGGWQGNAGSDAVCHERRSGGCIPGFPSLTSAAALVGWQVGGLSRGASVRALFGPTYLHAEGTKAVGLQSRVDLATRALFNVALVASARGVVVPSFGGDALALGALGLGVRLQ